MKEVLGAILSVIVVIGGALLFVYGASGDPYDHDDLRDLTMITGASLVFLVWMFWNDR
jgi:hypothetical protein